LGLALRNSAQERSEDAGGKSQRAPRSYLARRNWLLASLIDLLVFLPLVAFICFYNLNSPSINYRDETTHVRAIQEMRLSGHWWKPTVRGQPYLNKPPFKMWLTSIPLDLFGESAFSYRFLDALAGLLTCLSVYFFARALFASRLAGIFAALALIACPAYVFGHGVRKAVQDSMLVFLCTLATISGWYLIEAIEKKDKRGEYRLAALTGILVGLAVFTKSVAGFVPLIIGGTYLLCAGKLTMTLREALRPGLLLLALALSIPASYVVPHCLFTEGACATIFQAEVVDRAVEGYHNSDMFWFYFIRLFKDRQGVAPELLIPALAFGLFMARKGSQKYSFLLVWAITPLLLYTCYPSRLTWYISPSFPGMAILSGAMFAAAFGVLWPSARNWWQATERFGLGATLSSLILLSGAIGLGAQYASIGSGLFSLSPRHRTDLITEEILNFAEQHPAQGQVLSFDAPEFSLHESTYGGMIEPLITRVQSADELFRALDSDNFTYVLSSLEHADELFKRKPVIAYRYLRPLYDRGRWLIVLSYRTDLNPKELTRTKTLIDFGTSDVPSNFGIGQRELHGQTTVQKIFGSSASLSLEGDSALKNFGSSVELNMLVSDPRVRLIAKLNTEEVFRKEISRSGLRSQFFQIPPNTWKMGANTFFLQIENLDGSPIGEDESLVTLNWISFSLGMQQQEP